MWKEFLPQGRFITGSCKTWNTEYRIAEFGIVNAISASSPDNDKLNEIFTEVDGVRHGLGGIVKGIWEKDDGDWKQFLENQENNGKYNYHAV